MIVGLNVLFVQFAYDNYHKNNDSLILNNGFQHVEKECKNAGDLFWVKHFESDAEMKTHSLPIQKGNVFVSAFYYDHLKQTYYWAKKYPEINFLVGGPAVRYGNYSSDEFLPNLVLTKGLAEKEIFKQQDPSKKWSIDVPTELVRGKKEIRFGYNIDRRCYWGKCIFCEGYTKKWEQVLHNDITNLRIPEIDAKKMVRLNIPTVTPHLLINMLPKLPTRQDVVYDFFIKASKEINPVARKVIGDCARGIGPSPQQFRWVIGIEWPSHRMLQYMRKGSTVDQLVELIEIAGQYGIPVGMPFIFGWKNLTPQDVKEAKEFIRRVETIPNLNTSCVGFSLEVHPSAPLYQEFENDELTVVKKKFFNNGECRIKLNQEQYELNEEFKQYYLASKLNTYMYDSELGNVDVG